MAKEIKSHWSAQQQVEVRERVDGFRNEREAVRAEATRKASGLKYLRGDLHMHTVYSDGSGTVADMVRVGRSRGLDFMFVTDHGTIRQKVECARYRGVWWGQEPGAGPHHVCVLAGDSKFTPCGDMRRDADHLRELGHFFFYPHPVGWYPNVRYTQEQKDALAEAGPQFAIEIMNGIFRSETFHDEWMDNNVALWDRYLREGFRVTGLAATDSHFAPGVGNVWTGCIGARRTMGSVLKSLRSGNVFASAGPAVDLTCGRTPMGGEVTTKEATVEVSFCCADSRGLNWARLVQDGQVVKQFECRGDPSLDQGVRIALREGGGYVRVECASVDDRRGYSNPIYFTRP